MLRLLRVLAAVLAGTVLLALTVAVASPANAASVTHTMTSAHYACQSEAEPNNWAHTQVQNCWNSRSAMVSDITRKSHNHYRVWAIFYRDRSTRGGTHGTGPYLYLWSKYRYPCSHPSLGMPQIAHMPSGWNDKASYAWTSTVCGDIRFYRDSNLHGYYKEVWTGKHDLVSLGLNDAVTSVFIFTYYLTIQKH